MRKIQPYIKCIACTRIIIVDEPASRRVRCICGLEYTPSSDRTFMLLTKVRILTGELEQSDDGIYIESC